MNWARTARTMGGWIASAIIGGVIAVVGTSYINVAQHNRTVLEADFVALKATNTELTLLLDAYANRARTGSGVDEETQRKFRLALLKLYTEADTIARREPRLRVEFEVFQRALLELRDAADQVTGPRDAKRFVEATAEYDDAHRQFASKLAKLQKSFISQL